MRVPLRIPDSAWDDSGGVATLDVDSKALGQSFLGTAHPHFPWMFCRRFEKLSTGRYRLHYQRCKEPVR